MVKPEQVDAFLNLFEVVCPNSKYAKNAKEFRKVLNNVEKKKLEPSLEISRKGSRFSFIFNFFRKRG